MTRDHPSAPSSSASEPSPSLELEGIAHRFGRRWVLRGVDLRVDSGEVVALVGANGAGKTTVLRVAATLLRPLRGKGTVDGVELLDDPGEVRERVAILGHAPALYEDLTPEENLRFSLLMRGKEGASARIRELLRTVGLEEHASTRVRRFSAGMRRRVAIGRIRAALPRLLLMDEPFASLDPHGVDLVNETIRSITAAGGGVLLATHDVHSGAEITGRTLTLAGGRIVQQTERDREPHAPAGNGTG